MMKNSIILEVTNDEYELVVDFFGSTREASIKLGRSPECIRALISRSTKSNKKTKLIRVWLDKGEEYEK